jgi:hypothetical protein
MAEQITAAGGRRVDVRHAVLGRRPQAEPAPDEPVTELSADLADRLEAIVGRARRLMVYDRQPHRFHEEKDGVCRDLMQIAHELRAARRPGGQCGRRR